MSDAFISYSHLDRDFSVRLQTALKGAGKAIWVDETDIPSGSRWAEDLKVAIEEADTFVFVTSPDSVASVECQMELSYAVELLRQGISDGNNAVYAHIVCGEIRGNMTKSEWSDNIPDQPYHKTCPGYA